MQRRRSSESAPERDRARERDGADREPVIPRKGEDRATHPAPGVKHEPEPDAENIVPAEDRPGTL